MNQFKNKNIFSAFKNAFIGLKYLLKNHRHFKIEIFIALFVILVSFIFDLSYNEFLFIILAIFFVSIAEILNSLIEDILDVICPQYDERIKILKDVSSSVVLIAILFSLIIGIIIFGGKLFLPVF
jgi:diacylglycerol kinase